MPAVNKKKKLLPLLMEMREERLQRGELRDREVAWENMVADQNRRRAERKGRIPYGKAERAARKKIRKLVTSSRCRFVDVKPKSEKGIKIWKRRERSRRQRQAMKKAREEMAV